MKKYKCLNNQSFNIEIFKIIPIRNIDKYKIMNWRNDQLYHLRQLNLLTKNQQDLYFETTIQKLFENPHPDQILFSYLNDDECIGYGGLVHINWIDKNAEISFVLDTKLEEKYFKYHWSKFLKLIEKVAFEELFFKKIYTYAFDLRPKLYEVLESNNYVKEATLKSHCFFNEKYIDVVIHSKLNNYSLVIAKKENIKLYFDWVNEKNVRSNSLKSKLIEWDEHSDWFNNKLKNEKRIKKKF